MRRINYLLLLLILPLTSQAEESYHWPLQITPPYLTSSFAEYRPGHFHAGIDLKTWNKEGYACYAVADGYVSRLRTSARGYGNAVYLTLNDDHIVVYGHLQRFASPIAERVKQEQEKLQSYRTDFTLNPDEIPVKKGDLIAYSGSTGIGAPHLHFELQKLNDDPINPLTNGFPVEDHLKPQIQGISITPVGSHSKVNGGNDPVIFDTNQIPLVEGTFFIGANISDRQSTNIRNYYAPYRVELIWMTNNGDSLLFFMQFDEFSYSNTQQLDAVYDFDLRTRGEGRFYRLFRDNRVTVPIFGDQPFGTGLIHADRLSAGKHMFRIVAADFAGNTTETTFQVKVNQTPQITQFDYEKTEQWIVVKAKVDDPDQNMGFVKFERSTNSGRLWYNIENVGKVDSSGFYQTKWRYDSLPTDSPVLLRAVATDTENQSSPLQTKYIWVDVDSSQFQDESSPIPTVQIETYPTFWKLNIKYNRLLCQLPQVKIRHEDEPHFLLPVAQIDTYDYVSYLPLQPQYNGFLAIELLSKDIYGQVGMYVEDHRIAVIPAEEAGVVYLQNRLAALTYGEGAVYNDVYLQSQNLNPTDWEETVGKETPFVGPIIKITPENIPLREKILLSLQYDLTADARKVGVYQWSSKKKRWVFKDHILDVSQGVVSAKINAFSIYTVLEDQIPPRITELSPSTTKSYHQQAPTLSAKVMDSESGIFEDDIVVYLNDQKQIPVYDPETRSVQVSIDEELRRGEYIFTITVTDRAGNTTMRSGNFIIK